jgi:chromosome segregation ATPase
LEKDLFAKVTQVHEQLSEASRQNIGLEMACDDRSAMLERLTARLEAEVERRMETGRALEALLAAMRDELSQLHTTEGDLVGSIAAVKGKRAALRAWFAGAVEEMDEEMCITANARASLHDEEQSAREDVARLRSQLDGVERSNAKIPVLIDEITALNKGVHEKIEALCACTEAVESLERDTQAIRSELPTVDGECAIAAGRVRQMERLLEDAARRKLHLESYVAIRLFGGPTSPDQSRGPLPQGSSGRPRTPQPSSPQHGHRSTIASRAVERANGRGEGTRCKEK